MSQAPEHRKDPPHGRALLEEAARYLSDPALDGRAPGSEGHRAAAEYLENWLRRAGFQPLFDDGYAQGIPAGGGEIGRNLCGYRPGRSDRWVLVGAHYDHFAGICGADDNAAAVAIMLDAASGLLPWEGRSNLAYCFFDLEEPPYFLSPAMGSSYFAEHCPFDLARVVCAIVMDLCGHDVPIGGCENVLFAMGAESRRFLVQAVRAADSDALPILMARNERVGDMSDHHAFRVRGVPFLFLSCGWWGHYHRATDTFEKLNLEKMHAIAGAVAALAGHLDGCEGGTDPPRDFAEIEAGTLRRLTGLDIPPEEDLLRRAAERVIRKLA